MPNISVKRAPKNLTEWRSQYFKAYTSVAANLDFYDESPQKGAAGATKHATAEIHVLATVAGNFVVTRVDGTNVTLPCAVGWNIFPISVAAFVTAGSTVTVTGFVVYW